MIPKPADYENQNFWSYYWDFRRMGMDHAQSVWHAHAHMRQLEQPSDFAVASNRALNRMSQLFTRGY